MIIAKLMGGLGNQMFQYAAGKSLSIYKQTDLKVDTSFLYAETFDQYTKRHFELGVFDSNISKIESEDLRAFQLKYNNKINKFFSNQFPSIFKPHYFLEKGNFYHPEILDCSDNLYLNGFWQSEKYFQNHTKLIRDCFNIKPELLDNTTDWLKLISNTNSVSLHVRRGDYVSNSNANAFHGLCSIEYYQMAISTVAERNPKIDLFVFSDDIKWCIDNIKVNHTTHFVETGSACKDLYLMQNCKHNIIANSSFSWWGAWLNSNSDKIVVAPKKWFIDPSMSNLDIIPKNWITI